MSVANSRGFTLRQVSQRTISINDSPLSPPPKSSIEFWPFLLNEANILARSTLISLFNTYTRFYRYCFHLNFTLWHIWKRGALCVWRQMTDYFCLNLWTPKKFKKLWLKNAFNHTKELSIENARWFMYENDRWVPLKGHDSIRLEVAYREFLNLPLNKSEIYRRYHVPSTYFDIEKCAVLKGFYKPNDKFTYLVPIYWDDPFDRRPLRRGLWFDHRRQPLDPEVSEIAEARHISAVNSRKILPVGLNYENFCRYGAMKNAKDSIQLPKILHTDSKKKIVWTSMVDVYIEDDINIKQQNSFFNSFFNKTFLTTPIHELGSSPIHAIFDLMLCSIQIYGYMVVERFWNRKPIRRGYLPSKFYEDKPSVDHLIFVIHGIGQYGNPIGIREQSKHIQKTLKLLDISKNMVEFGSCNIRRKKARKLQDRKSRKGSKVIRNVVKTQIPTPVNVKHSPFVIPIEWRSVIDIPEEMIDLITPVTNIRELRRNLHFTLMDVMYYMSPEYQNEIISKAISRFNEAYHEFINYNPTFKGSISIIGHSLGSVITYDIITNYEAGEDDEIQYGSMESERPLRRAISLEGDPLPEEEAEKLDFKVNNAFLIGSPLALFMVARGRRYQQAMLDQLKNPHTKFKLYNIIHPLDPIAYRIEPTFHPIYSNNTPEPIFPCYNRYFAQITFPEMHSSQTEYYYCATDLAQGAREYFRTSHQCIPKQDRLKNRLDFYVLPLLEEMGHWRLDDKTRNRLYSAICCKNCPKFKKSKRKMDLSFLLGFHYVNIIISAFILKDILQGDVSKMEKSMKYLGVNYCLGLATYFLWPYLQNRQIRWLLDSIFVVPR